MSSRNASVGGATLFCSKPRGSIGLPGPKRFAWFFLLIGGSADYVSVAVGNAWSTTIVNTIR